MPRPSRKSLAFLVSAASVSAGLGLAVTPHAFADDQSQPHNPGTDSSQCGNFLSDGPEGAGKIAACPLVDPKFSFQPPTDKATPPPASGSRASTRDSDDSDDNDAKNGDSNDGDSNDNGSKHIDY
jgi:hypothetical protein